jgi:hypothetical protein
VVLEVCYARYRTGEARGKERAVGRPASRAAVGVAKNEITGSLLYRSSSPSRPTLDFRVLLVPLVNRSVPPPKYFLRVFRSMPLCRYVSYRAEMHRLNCKEVSS